MLLDETHNYLRDQPRGAAQRIPLRGRFTIPLSLSGGFQALAANELMIIDVRHSTPQSL